MNPELAAMLAQPVRDAAVRAGICAWRRRPCSAPARLETAQRLLARGETRLAALWLLAGWRDNIADPGFAYRLANTLRLAGRDRAAAKLLGSLVAAHPGWGEPAQSLAWLHRRAGRAEAAAEVLEHWAAELGYPPRALRAVTHFLREMGLDARAERLLAQAPATGTDSQLAVERGELLLRLGHFAEAEALLRKVVTDDPERTDACVRLAHVRRWETPAASPLDLLGAALQRTALDGASRTALFFALAKVNDDLGRFAEAFAAAERGNALRARDRRADLAEWRRYEKSVYETFTPSYFRRHGSAVRASERPVFVVGMPRSGTTVVEQRLGRHPALTAAGELDVVETLVRELQGRNRSVQRLEETPADGWQWAAEEWRRRLPVALASSPRLIDKNPLNFLYLGFIALALPEARIVHCRRDPLDTAVSIYFQNFAHPHNDFAFDLSDIAAVTGIYGRIMAHWERVLPLPLHVVQYEELVESPEQQLRSLIAFLGLDWHPACLESGGPDVGAIATASVWQARQPIYRHSVGRWRAYAPFLGPLRKALAEEGVTVKA